MKTFFDFDGGDFYPPNPYDFKKFTLRGCLLNIIKLIVIFVILFFVLSKLIDRLH